MNNAYRTSRGFSRLPDAELNSFTSTVLSSMADNPGYPSPLVTMDTLEDARSTFSAAIDAAADGGTEQTAAKHVARETLIGLLRQEATYVQGVASNDLPLLISSGFKPVSTNRTRISLPQPMMEKIDNPKSGQIGLRLQAVPTAHAYEIRVSYGVNGWETAGVFTNSRSIIIPDLTPGTVYNLQARAIGGTTGYSDWSDAVSHMAT